LQLIQACQFTGELQPAVGRAGGAGKFSASIPPMIKRKIPQLFIVVVLLCSIFSLFGCNDDAASPPVEPSEIIHLDKLAPLPETVTEKKEKTFKIAIAAILSPRGTVDSYQPLLSYFERRLGKPVQLVQRRTYGEINNLIARNAVDMAFICTGAFYEGLREKQMTLLAVPQINGKLTYNALIIVPADSPVQKLEDLHNRIFAFTDPLSNTGYQYPMGLLAARDLDAENFFRRTIFTYSHDYSIQAVAEEVADAASVDSLVYAYAVKRDPSIAEKTRIILRSEDFGMPPVVASVQAPPEEILRIRTILLSMADTRDGASILEQLGIDRFAYPGNDLYQEKGVKSCGNRTGGGECSNPH